MTMQKITIARIFGICLFLGMGCMSLGAQWAYMMRVNGCRYQIVGCEVYIIL